MAHPCCGGSLQTGTKIVAIIQIIISVLLIIFALFLILGGVFLTSNAEAISNVTFTASKNSINEETTEPQENDHDGDNETDNDPAANLQILGAVIIGLSVFCIFKGILTLILGIILLKGANQRHIGKCKIWLIVRCIFVLISIVSFFSGFIENIGHFQGSNVVEIILDVYCIWVVYAFIMELRLSGEDEERKRDSVKHIVSNQKFVSLQ